MTEPVHRIHLISIESTWGGRLMSALSSHWRMLVKTCQLSPQTLGESQPESAMSSCYNKQALDFLFEAISPEFSRFLEFFWMSIFLLPKCTLDFQPLLHFNHQCLVCLLFLLTCLTSELNFCTDLHSFLLPGSSLQTNIWFIPSPNALLLSCPLFWCQHHPQILPGSQLTLYLFNIRGLSISKRLKWSWALGLGDIKNWKKKILHGDIWVWACSLAALEGRKSG